MKKILSMLLAIILLFSSASVLAEAPVITNEKSIHSYFGKDNVFDHSTWKPVGSFDLSAPAQITSKIYTNGEYFNTPQIDGVSAGGVQVNAGTIVLNWNGLNTDDWHPANQSVKFIVDIFAQNADGQDSASFDFWYTFQHSIADHVKAVISNEPVWTESRTKVFSHNTVCSFGPHFRDVSPDLTDKWYMFTPIDLSEDGTQAYELVGGNAYVIGKVYVTVNDDEVVVEYKYNEDVYAYDEFYTFFADYDSVTTVNPEEIDTSYEYGQKLSIANDLDGDTDVLLFTCNTATFKSDNKAITRFYENIDWRKEIRAQMLEMIGKAETVK